MHYSKLHKTPRGSCIYCGIIKERLKALTNHARIHPKFKGFDREITVLPLKKDLYGPNKAMELYSTPLDRHLISSYIHFHIIEGATHNLVLYRSYQRG